MKRSFTFLFLSLFIISTPLDAQIQEEYILSEGPFSNIHKVLVLNDAIYAAGGQGSCKSPHVNLIENGYPKFFFGSTIGGHWHYTDIQMSRDATPLLYVAGYYRSHDDVAWDGDAPYFAIFESDGRMLSETTLSNPDIEIFGSAVPEFTQTADGNILYKAMNRIYRLSNQGAELGFKDFPVDRIIGLEMLNDSVVIAIASDVIYWLDNEGNILDSNSTLVEDAVDLSIKDEKALLLMKDNLLEIDYPVTIQNIKQHPYLFTNTEAVGITHNEQDFFIWSKFGQNPNTIYNILRFDPQNPFNSAIIDFPQSRVNITDVHATAEDLVIAGTQNVSNGSDLWLETAFVKTSPIFDQPQFEQDDISLLSFDNQSNIRAYPGDFGYIIQATPFVYELEIQNSGRENLTSFAFTSNKLNGFNCAELRLYRQYENLNLAPGESIIIKDSFPSISFGQYSDPYRPINIEVAVFSPNHHFDDDIDNNYRSLTLTSLPEVVKAQPLQLLPNPVNDVLNINIDREGAFDLQFFDAYGKEVQSLRRIDGLSEQQIRIQVEDWPSGIYFLQMRDQDRKWTKKFVVQH